MPTKLIYGSRRNQPTKGSAHAKHRIIALQMFRLHGLMSEKRRSPSTLTMPVRPRLSSTVRKARITSAGRVNTPLTNEPAFSARDSMTNAISPKKKKFTSPKPKARPEVWLMMACVFVTRLVNNAPMTRKYAARVMVSRMTMKKMRRMSVLDFS